MKIHRSFCVSVGIVAVVFLLCKAFGLGLCAVQTGSMEPAIPTYSVCLVSTRVSYDDLNVGDIIVYVRPSDNARIIHRVVEITPDGIVTKGDANQFVDSITVTESNLYARYIGHIPYAAHLYNLFHFRYSAGIIVGLAVILFAIEAAEAKRKH